MKAQESTPIDVEFQATYIVLDDKGSTLRPKVGHAALLNREYFGKSSNVR